MRNKFLRFQLRNSVFMACVFMLFVIAASFIVPDASRALDPNMRISMLLESLGDDAIEHFPNTEIFGVSAKRGEMIVKEGFSTKPGGGKTRRQSKHFVCTSCHNLQKEDPDLSISDPQARLEYVDMKGMPFLQGSSLYGVVNRTSFYNGDYYKKYGELVTLARNDIREAIKLCAVECAQGRELDPWELESVLAYLWTIDLKLSDLKLSEDELDFISNASGNSMMRDSALSLVKSKFRADSPAQFTTAHESILATAELIGNPDNGKMIYDRSCLHCHDNRRYSFFLLDDSPLTFKHLSDKSGGYGRHSIYQVVRFGVYPRAGKKSYMPQYPLEKMSEQQLADLDAYIQIRASEG